MPNNFDWKNPDYVSAYKERFSNVAKIRAAAKEDPKVIPALKTYYKDHPADFISDFGITYDPRNIEVGLPAVIPFILFPKQREWIDWVIDKWRNQKPGITEKTRDMGMSWVAVSLACTLCLFYEGMAIGFGSRKEEYVDKIGSPKCLFFKARMFMQNLPIEFRGGWNSAHNAPHMRLNFPESGSNISGESGDGIGRGDRTSIYFVDESAHLERPELVDASLSMTTNCRQDISSANGPANPFAIKRHSGAIDVFTLHWRDDPRKDQLWYDKKVAELNNPVVVAQEIDINYSASVEGVVIPSSWVQTAIDAHVKLAFAQTGRRFGALDVADEGQDLNAFCLARGVLIEFVEEWSGKNSDIYQTVLKAFDLCDEHNIESFRYDANGLGAGVRGDANTINLQRKASSRKQIKVEAFRGSGSVVNPTKEEVKGITNEDYFQNLKAQSWWSLRSRFQKTFRAVIEGVQYDPDELISLYSGMPNLQKLCMELSQPTYKMNPATGKMMINKKPDGARSPNKADAVMIRFSPLVRSMVISDDLLRRSMQGAH